jgi:hypothetical protein
VHASMRGGMEAWTLVFLDIRHVVTNFELTKPRSASSQLQAHEDTNLEMKHKRANQCQNSTKDDYTKLGC